MMKKVLLLLATLLVSTIMFAQAPQKMSYQAVIRDNNGQLVTNQNIGIRISILQGLPTSAAVYEETQTAATNVNGLVSLEIGTGAVTVGSALSSIDWSDGPYYIKTETDIAGGTNYTITGTSELLSVPYALHANTADSVIHANNEFISQNGVVHNTTDTTNDNFVFGSTTLDGTAPRLFFNKSKAAFRAGQVIGTQWDNDSVGNASTAMGYNTTASGDYSTAMGINTTASGDGSTAMGINTTASGDGSTAMGVNATASGDGSTAMGVNATASGDLSTAMGVNTTASGDGSTSMGVNTTASGANSTAMGTLVSTNGYNGSFAIGDNNAFQLTNNTANNQMMMRFDGGYMFYTNSGASIGAQLLNGSNSWSTISDSNKKENFLPVNTNYFLSKIKDMRLTSWNYKGQDPKHFRHYGPMAQDFFAAFGKDELGIIGNDTTIGQADMEGVTFIAVQGLIKENDSLKAAIAHQAALIQNLQEEVTQANSKNNEHIQELRAQVLALADKINAQNSNTADQQTAYTQK